MVWGESHHHTHAHGVPVRPGLGAVMAGVDLSVWEGVHEHPSPKKKKNLTRYF